MPGIEHGRQFAGGGHSIVYLLAVSSSRLAKRLECRYDGVFWDTMTDRQVDPAGYFAGVTWYRRRDVALVVARVRVEADVVNVRVSGTQRRVFAAEIITTQIAAVEHNDECFLARRVGVDIVSADFYVAGSARANTRVRFVRQIEAVYFRVIRQRVDV